MKKTPILLLPLLINSVFSMKSADLHLFKMAQLGIAALGLGHVLYQNEKNTTEQRKKGHIFTSISDKNGRIAIPGEDALVRKAMDNACELPAHVITLPIRLIVSPFEICARTGFCTKETYESVLEYTIGKTMPVSGCLLIASLLATAPLLVINDWMFKTPTEKFKAEYIAANPSEYLKQVKANHPWFVKDLASNISDEDIVFQGNATCDRYNRENMIDHEPSALGREGDRVITYKPLLEQKTHFCSDMRVLRHYISQLRNS